MSAAKDRLIVLAPSREQAENVIREWWRERPGRRRANGIYINRTTDLTGIHLGSDDRVVQVGPDRRIRHRRDKVAILERAATKRRVKLTIERV